MSIHRALKRLKSGYDGIAGIKSRHFPQPLNANGDRYLLHKAPKQNDSQSKFFVGTGPINQLVTLDNFAYYNLSLSLTYHPTAIQYWIIQLIILPALQVIPWLSILKSMTLMRKMKHISMLLHPLPLVLSLIAVSSTLALIATSLRTTPGLKVQIQLL